MNATDLPVDDLQKVFCEAVLRYHHGEWSPGQQDFPRVSLQGKSYSLREICDFVKADHQKLPDDIARKLFDAMHSNHPRLTEKLGETATFAVGSECFAEILEGRVRKFQQRQKQ
jgi:hypothetical protein